MVYYAHFFPDLSEYPDLKSWLIIVCLVSCSPVLLASDEPGLWFEDLKGSADRQALYQVLHAMPKGGDLHSHSSGAVFSEWWYEMALEQAANGYVYYTKTRIMNCRDYGGDEFGQPYLLYFSNIQASRWATLSECEQGEYKRLSVLTNVEKSAWLNSIRLDKPHEGRDEFFQAHWQRLGDLTANPYLAVEAVVRNIKAFSAEGLIYMEPDFNVFGAISADGTPVPPDEVAELLRARLRQKDVTNTGMVTRFQLAILRFLPGAPELLKPIYTFLDSNRDLWVSLDLVGREDNDKGYPAKFLEAFREVRRTHHGIRLSIHGGEVDEPNRHVRDTLILGAERIGHGVNLISDPDLMLLMRGGPYLVEVNLVSNLLLEYVTDFSQHPFPEYLRLGIPVALSTDDRGMWDSTMTDEFFVAVMEFNLSWEEIKQLSRNSLKHAFVSDELKGELLARYNKRIAAFERSMVRGGMARLNSPDCRRFIRNHYDLCGQN